MKSIFRLLAFLLLTHISCSAAPSNQSSYCIPLKNDPKNPKFLHIKIPSHYNETGLHVSEIVNQTVFLRKQDELKNWMFLNEPISYMENSLKDVYDVVYAAGFQICQTKHAIPIKKHYLLFDKELDVPVGTLFFDKSAVAMSDNKDFFMGPARTNEVIVYKAFQGDDGIYAFQYIVKYPTDKTSNQSREKIYKDMLDLVNSSVFVSEEKGNMVNPNQAAKKASLNDREHEKFLDDLSSRRNPNMP